MTDRLPPADLRGIRTTPLAGRRHKVSLRDLASPVDPSVALGAFLDGLPGVLAVEELRGLARAMARAGSGHGKVVVALGGHVVKTGLAPVIVQLVDEGLVHAIVLNGAAAIHDWELAAVGATSEFVEDGLHEGAFGTADETGRAFQRAAADAVEREVGLGEALAEGMVRDGLPHLEASLIAGAHRRGVPVTVHVAVGCDVVHVHPDFDGAALGRATYDDFRRVVGLVGSLGAGVWINVGSAVHLPEVFLKAISASANLGRPVSGLTTANLDMVRHYRTDTNVLARPTVSGGRSHGLIGHHELLLPLLAAAAIRERRRADGDAR